jgi:ankyrin repeat protein
MALLLNWVLKDKRKDVINFKDDEGMTALHLSVMAGTGNIVSMLLQRGADKHIENNQGVTPLDLIKESSSPQMKSFQLVHHWYKPCQSSVKKEKVI